MVSGTVEAISKVKWAAACLLLLSTLLALAQDADLTETPGAPLASETFGANANETPEVAISTANALANIEPAAHFVLQRPIAISAANVHWVDRTYPYGSTQWNTRPVHLGVEFVNPRNTPVLAAAAGRVVFAGSDAQVLIGPREDYYGKVVILAHDLHSLDGLPLFTLYAHLEQIDVQQAAQVEAGDRIGRVGSTGIAQGAHLHFEVRVDDPFIVRNTRNPELWLENYANRGLIAGFIHDDDGDPIYGKRLVIRSDQHNREVYTYGSDAVNSDSVWAENFVVGDLPADEYEIVVLKENGAIGFRERVEVRPHEITTVDILISE